MLTVMAFGMKYLSHRGLGVLGSDCGSRRPREGTCRIREEGLDVRWRSWRFPGPGLGVREEVLGVTGFGLRLRERGLQRLGHWVRYGLRSTRLLDVVHRARSSCHILGFKT